MAHTGPRENFETVAFREVEVLYRVAKRLATNATDAEDLVGQTLLNAATHWDSFDGRHARSWLIQILRNEWLQMLRRRNVRQEVGYEAVGEPADEGFWRKVEVRLESELIVQTLDTLDEPYRMAITLCDVEGMDHKDAAEALEVPQATLRTHLHRGRKLLQAKLVSLSPG